MTASTIKKKLETRNILILIPFTIIILNVISVYSLDCNSSISLGLNSCFNKITIFDHKKIRKGHFLSHKEDDLLIEYADEDNTNSRIFYGLKNNGDNFFPTENGFFEYSTAGNSDGETDYNDLNRFESINYFVTLKNENDIFPSQLFLIGINGNSEFIISFGINDGKNETCETLYMIKKFKLKSFSQAPYEELGFINVTRQTQSLRKTFFSIDQSESFIFVPIDYVSESFRYSGETFFYNLRYIKNAKLTNASQIKFEDEMFFKSIILKEDYLAFLYFSEINKGNSLNILIAQYKNLTNDLSRNLLLSYNIEGINYVTNVSMSDFFRLDEKRAGFISTEGNPDNINRKLHIILFHFSPDYKKMKARRYSYYLTNYIFVNELSGTFYNGHLVLSATALLKKNII